MTKHFVLTYKDKVHHNLPEDHPLVEEWRRLVKISPLYKMFEEGADA